MKRALFAIAALAMSAAELPRVLRVAPAAPDVLAVEIEQGRIEPVKLVPYLAEAGDKVDASRTNPLTGEPREVRLMRGGEFVGYLLGKDRKMLGVRDRVMGDPLDLRAADEPASYAVGGQTKPIAVWRKSKPSNWADVGFAPTYRHIVYLKLTQPMRDGETVSLAFRGLNVTPASIEYKHDSMRIRSESVHVSHVGFRPDDPVKVAFLSLWMGTGGAYAFGQQLPFAVIDEVTRKRVHEGRAEPAWKADRPEKYGRQVNYVKADVARLDLSGVTKAGKYRVCVESVGCSYPFEIAPDVWDRAFRLAMTGQYVHRSGIELGSPYTEFKRPRCFHPDDGVKVYQSTCSLMHSGNGLNILGTETNNFDCLVKGRTEQIVPGVWGGYMDAGDWDRRIQHLEATRLHLELMELMPQEFSKTTLNLPESGNALPDLVDEALFGLDVYRRLQMPDGGIRGGIESSEHPVSGETSWLESQMVLTYAPDPWSSYAYAGVAARASLVLRGFDAKLAGVYERSAVRALRWAEDDWAKWKGSAEFAKARKSAVEEVERERALALIEAYRLTRDSQWHTRFLAALTQYGGFAKLPDVAFVYARLPNGLGDVERVADAAREVAASGDRAVEFSRNNAFGLATAHLRPGPYGAFYTVPADPQLVRAHALTRKPEYLEAIVRGAQYSAGANPINITMTSGVGHDFPRNMLHEDMKHSGQPMPPGVTVYGPYDLAMIGKGEQWVMPMLEKQCTPPPREWPAAEAYFDIYIWASMTEYTVMQTLGPTAYVWGYLAKRK